MSRFGLRVDTAYYNAAEQTQQPAENRLAAQAQRTLAKRHKPALRAFTTPGRGTAWGATAHDVLYNKPHKPGLVLTSRVYGKRKGCIFIIRSPPSFGNRLRCWLTIPIVSGAVVQQLVHLLQHLRIVVQHFQIVQGGRGG